MQSSGVLSSNGVPVTVLHNRRKAFFFLPSPGCKRGPHYEPALRGHGNTKSVQTNAFHALVHPLLTPPLQSGRGLVTLLGDQRYRYHTSSLAHPLPSGRVCSHSIATDVPSAHPLNIPPPRYHPPLPAVGFLCMVHITGGALDTTPPYKSTPGDDIF